MDVWHLCLIVIIVIMGFWMWGQSDYCEKLKKDVENEHKYKLNVIDRWGEQCSLTVELANKLYYTHGQNDTLAEVLKNVTENCTCKKKD